MTYTIQMRNIVLALALGFLIVTPFAVSAQFTAPTDQQNPGLAPDTPGQNALVGTIVSVTEFLASLLAVLAILIIVVAGILYMTSGGDEGRISTAKTWLTYAIIGLIVALLAWVIVSTVAGALGAG